MTHQLIIESEVSNQHETINFAKNAVKFFRPGDTVLLYGDLGSGKTFLTRSFVRLLGSDADVTSPSFSLINQYENDVLINHVDLYRVHNKTELINIGLDDLWSESTITFIEWPELIEHTIDWPHYRIYIVSDAGRETWRKLQLLRYDR
jgi:tRNA threonylcarbamoyladenosine biosynthesis protein TsaE